MRTLKGMYDILPQGSIVYQFIDSTMRRVSSHFAYQEIKTPILEEERVFKAGIGDTTDIVQKEMYSFTDRGGRTICLRPEGTAAIVRACLQHNLVEENQITRLFYTGPMFRAERPQAGRNRQFYQMGAEAIGSIDPYVDAEIILFNDMIFKEMGLKNFSIHLNSLGSNQDKDVFRKRLRERLADEKQSLCTNCQERFDSNILRVLDCKENNCLGITKKAVKGVEYLSDASKKHFETVQELLSDMGISFEIDPYLVRGLDYYTDTVFEFKADSLGAQNAISAGGRYNNLFKSMGSKKDVGACGFALGIDRVMLLIDQDKQITDDVQSLMQLDVYFIALGDAAKHIAFKLMNEAQAKGLSCQMDYLARPLKKQLKFADKSQARYAVIIGEEELAGGKLLLKDLQNKEQNSVDQKILIDEMLELSKKGS